MGVHDTVKLLDSISRLPGDTFVHTTLLTAVWERIHAQSRSMSIEEVSSVLLSISRLLHYQKNNNIQLNCNRLQESLFMNQHPSSSDGDAFTATELRTHASDLLSGISRLAGSLTIDPWLPIVQRLIEVMDPSKMKSDDSLYTAHPLVRLGVADAYLAEELLRNVRLSSGTNTAVELCMVLHTIMKARAPEKIVHSLNRDVLRVACELNHKNKQQTKHMTFVLFATGRTMKDFGPDEQKHAKLLLEDMLTRIHECSSKHVVGCLVACTRVDGIDRAMVSKFLLVASVESVVQRHFEPFPFATILRSVARMSLRSGTIEAITVQKLLKQQQETTQSGTDVALVVVIVEALAALSSQRKLADDDVALLDLSRRTLEGMWLGGRLRGATKERVRVVAKAFAWDSISPAAGK
eukprot:PhM_4_TR9758/c2_g1_i8/m.34488